MINIKISELLCPSHQGDDYEENFGMDCPICSLKSALRTACKRLDGSPYADSSDEFLELCEIAGYTGPGYTGWWNDDN